MKIVSTETLHWVPSVRATRIAALAGDVEPALDLQMVAYENNHTPVFHAWLNLEPEARIAALRDRYVFFSFTNGVGVHLGGLLKVDIERANAFVGELIDAIDSLMQTRVGFSEEWFKGLACLVGAFIDHHYLPEARTLVAIGLRTGVSKYPRIAQSLSVHAAYLDALNGRRDKAAKVALRLVRSPYLLPNRRELPALCYRLMYILAGGNYLREYRLVLWTGVTNLNARPDLRYAFADQIVKTYRGALRAVLNSDVPFKYRLPFGLINVAHVLSRIPVLRLFAIDVPVRWIYVANLYVLDRLVFRKNELFREANRVAHQNIFGVKTLPVRRSGFLNRLKNTIFTRPRRKKILITRAMGGIGDILMMTPGILALKKKYPRADIDFAVPKSFHALLEGLPGVNVVDIDEGEIELSRYQRWVNLTDCPAGRIESRQYPNVRHNRIEIFARAMGVTKRLLKRTVGFLPFYLIKPEERANAIAFLEELNPDGLPVIGVQPYAADSYRNWSDMENMVRALAENNCVLVFHYEQMDNYNFGNVHKIIKPLRESVALLSLCKKMVAVDSSFLHLSAALGVPTVAVFGAISGKLRTQSYPNVRLVAPIKSEFPCYPCWRHEHKPCHLTNGRESACFRSISIQRVLDAVFDEVYVVKESMLTKVKNWIFYGRA